MLILKGIIIGIGKIIPGVSGSMLAISMGIYQKLINSINNFFDNPKENFKFLFKVGIGSVISIIFFSNIILSCLNKYYLITIFFFLGLILGSFNDISKNINKKDKYIIYIFLILSIILGLFNINNELIIYNTFFNFLFYIFVGFVDAFTMVIPGISGTATLMMIGVYDSLIECFSNLLNFSMFFDNIKILIPFLIGLAIGIILTVKLVNYLFNNYKSQTYGAILGFSISTIVLMAVKCINTYYTLIQLIIGFIMLFIGMFLSKKINHYFSND